MEKTTTPQSVLIIDEDYQLGSILASFLAMHKYKVAQAKRMREGLFKLRNQQFDILLVDPVFKNDHQFFRALEDFAQLKPQPKILFMTFNLEYAVPSNLPFAIKGVLKKPFTIEDFWKAIA